MSALSRLRERYMAAPTAARLRAYLTAKAALGMFDERMCGYYGVSPHVNAGCRRAICRAYAANLVPTSTTGGSHAATSYHPQGRAVDFGLRRELVGTAQGAERLRTFQRKELWRFRKGRVGDLVELLGPVNEWAVLRDRETDLAEGAALETQHDNHVHEAYR